MTLKITQTNIKRSNMKVHFKKWSKAKTQSHMARHWTKTPDAYNHFANISGWSWHTIKKWRYQLSLPDNRIKHGNKTKTNR